MKLMEVAKGKTIIEHEVANNGHFCGYNERKEKSQRGIA